MGPDQRIQRLEEALGLSDDSADGEQRTSVQALIHELHVHQIELETQNDELRSAQDALEEARTKYLDLFDFAPTGYLTLDQSDCVVEVNLAAATLLGVQRRNLIGRRLTAFIEPGNRDEYLRHRRRARRACELRLRPHAGQPLLVRLECARDEGTGHVRVAIVDLTDRWHVEEERRRAGDELARKVAERTEQLTEAVNRLEEEIAERERADVARRVAEEELERQRVLSLRRDRLISLGQLAAGVAHELNQPLVGVRGLAEHLVLALERDWDLPRGKLLERLVRIIQQADRMTHIIDHIRLFAKEAHRRNIGPVELNETVSSALGLVTEQLRAQGIELRTEYAESLPPVLANFFSLEEVVLNLVNNARDAVIERRDGDPSAPSWVCLRTVQSESTPRIQIIDPGCGMSNAVRARAFEPFFTTKEPDRGTGLGLSICQTIVDEFGGSVQIVSAMNEGTTVTVSLSAALAGGNE